MRIPVEAPATAHLFPLMRAELLRVLNSLSADQWSAPTACAGWSVRDVALHILGACFVWLAVLASVVGDREVERLALAAMAAVALAAAFVALCPAAPAPGPRDASPMTREDETHVL